MRYESAKGPAAVKLGGIRVDFETNNNQLRAVIFEDGMGGHVKVAIDSYNLMCLVPAPPKTEKRYVLHGEIDDIGNIRRVFASKYEAEQAKRDIEGKVRGDDYDLSIDEADIPVDDAGEIIESDIPF